MTFISTLMLADRGELDLYAPVADYWPEFSANGKQDVSVADLMRHEAGLAALRTSVPPADLRTENIKRNAVGRIIESHGQAFHAQGPRAWALGPYGDEAQSAR